MPSLLIVDDNVELAGLLAAAAKEQGLAPRVAYSGKEALSAVEQAVPEAALIDLMLPDVGGKTLLKALREKGIATFAMSGVFRGRHVARAATETCGALAFFEKPLTARDTLARIAELLSAPRPAPAPAPTPPPAAAGDPDLDWSDLDRERFGPPDPPAPAAASEPADLDLDVDIDIDVELDDAEELRVEAPPVAAVAAPTYDSVGYVDPRATPVALPPPGLIEGSRPDDDDRPTPLTLAPPETPGGSIAVPGALPFASALDERTTPARPSGPAAHPEPDDRPTPAYPLKNPPKGEALETIEGPETEARPTVAIRKRKPRLAGEQPTLTGKESVEQVSELPSVDELLEGPVPLSPGVFARMLSGLSLRRATGELRVKRAPLVKVLGLKEGALCFAASNVGAERLSRFAVEQGKVPADRLAELKERVQKGARTGEALVAMGLVSETERAELVARLVREIAWSMLDATAGELRFAAQAPERKNLLPMSLDPLPLLVEGYRALPLLRLRELFDRGRLYFRVAEPAWTAGQLGLSEKESHLLAAADGSKKIEDLALLSELGERECLAVVTALTHLGLLEGRAPAGREPVLV